LYPEHSGLTAHQGLTARSEFPWKHGFRPEKPNLLCDGLYAPFPKDELFGYRLYGDVQLDEPIKTYLFQVFRETEVEADGFQVFPRFSNVRFPPFYTPVRPVNRADEVKEFPLDTFPERVFVFPRKGLHERESLYEKIVARLVDGQVVVSSHNVGFCVRDNTRYQASETFISKRLKKRL
jgi:hypothetical protein